jgi:FixJ family two-component response regulator
MMTTLSPCPLELTNDHICGCRTPPALKDGKELISIISSDAAVRRALVLLLEAEGMPAKAFCVLPAFLSVMGRMPGKPRHCVVIEEEQTRGLDTAALVRRIARDGQPVSLIVLTSPSHGRYSASPPQDGVAFVDPFKVDEVLRAARQALGSA